MKNGFYCISDLKAMIKNFKIGEILYHRSEDDIKSYGKAYEVKMKIISINENHMMVEVQAYYDPNKNKFQVDNYILKIEIGNGVLNKIYRKPKYF
jgi:hypothetical protein